MHALRARSLAASLRQAPAARSLSAWSSVVAAPPDPIIGLNNSFAADPDASKVLLGVGAYRDGAGKPFVLPSIKEAEQRVFARGAGHEYAAITGDAEFLEHSLAFAYGADSAPLKEGRVAAAQTLSGTGCLRVAGQLLATLPALTGSGAPKAVYVPAPTWGNHTNIFRDSGLEVRTYRYLDAETKTTLDFGGMMEDLAAAEPGATVLLHACAHNPTGVDPAPAQWAELSKALAARGDLQIFFDCAYQGFASGDAERDAGALRTFVADGHHILLGQSYAKNFGLYGQRVGALSAVCASPEEAKALESQLKAVIRPMYSSPPVHGARIVAEVLGDPALRAKWTGECRAMADRIIEMRAALKEGLAKAGSTRDWTHITDQIGMFAFTGLSKAQVERIRDEYHVYFTLDGRISVAGLNADNVQYVAEAIHAVSK